MRYNIPIKKGVEYSSKHSSEDEDKVIDLLAKIFSNYIMDKDDKASGS